ncbi:MAG: ATP-grasp domain-containing protein [Cyanobacteria bacterium P01_E01_bin.42]
MIILSEDSDRLPPSASRQENHTVTEAAKLLGAKVYYIPDDFSLCGTAENALWHIPKQAEETLGIWIGYIPTLSRYEAIYAAALNKNIRLLNNPTEHLLVQECDRACERLQELTPETFILTHQNQCQSAIEKVGLPAFVKGAVQSRKKHGWKACVAENLDELEQLTVQLLSLEGRTRGRVLVRKLVKLRYSRTSGEGFPLGREYRVFLYRQKVLGYGYYWDGDDPLKILSEPEKQQVLNLAKEAARRVNVPYIAIDIGQSKNGRWLVIETGDPQFSGVSQIPLLPLWNQILQIDRELKCLNLN